MKHFIQKQTNEFDENVQLDINIIEQIDNNNFRIELSKLNELQERAIKWQLDTSFYNGIDGYVSTDNKYIYIELQTI